MPAQPTISSARRFVENPRSVIGRMILRGSRRAAAPLSSKEEEPGRMPGNPDLDVLEQVLTEVETAAPAESVTEVPAEQVAESATEPIAEQSAPEQSLASQLAAASAEGVLPQVASQVLPQVMKEAADALDPALNAPVPLAGSLRKEAPEAAGLNPAIDQVVDLSEAAPPDQLTTSEQPSALEQPVSLEQVAAEVARSAQSPETAPTPELSPEVESYLQKVEDSKDMAPPEVVIADGSQTQPAERNYPAQPVVVLPITPEEEKTGERKSAKFSVRWLVEWSRKLMKMFTGKVVYQPAPTSERAAAEKAVAQGAA